MTPRRPRTAKEKKAQRGEMRRRNLNYPVCRASRSMRLRASDHGSIESVDGSRVTIGPGPGLPAEPRCRLSRHDDSSPLDPRRADGLSLPLSRPRNDSRDPGARMLDVSTGRMVSPASVTVKAGRIEAVGGTHPPAPARGPRRRDPAPRPDRPPHPSHRRARHAGLDRGAGAGHSGALGAPRRQERGDHARAGSPRCATSARRVPDVALMRRSTRG